MPNLQQILVTVLSGGGGLGPELITNDDFSAWTGGNPDGWTVTEDATDTVTQDGANNVVVLTDGGSIGNGPQIAQTPGLTNGVTYEFTLVVDSISAGQLRVRQSGTTLLGINAPGTYTQQFDSIANDINLIQVTPGVSNVSSFSLKRVL